MAAVAAEPGAAVVPTTTTTSPATTTARDEAQPEPGPGEPADGVGFESDVARDVVVRHLKDGDVVVVVKECGHVRPELEAAAGKALAARAAAVAAEDARGGEEENKVVVTDGGGELLSECTLTGGAAGDHRLAPDGFPAPAGIETEVGCGSNVTAVYQKSILADSQPSVVFLHSFPAHAPATEAGLSLAEPAEPTTNVTANECRHGNRNRAEPSRTQSSSDMDSYRALTKTELGSEPTGSSDADAAREGGGLRPDITVEPVSAHEHQGQPTDAETRSYGHYGFMSVSGGGGGSYANHVDADDLNASRRQPGSTSPGHANGSSSPAAPTGSPSARSHLAPRSPSPPPCRSPKRRSIETAATVKQERMSCEPAATEPSDGAAESKPAEALGSVAQLTPGSEVRVSLDHIIDDALVVSFRVGEKVFSGVLMDLSKRFGPYGIPITVLPQRDYKDRPQQSMQLQPPQQINAAVEGAAVPDVATTSPACRDQPCRTEKEEEETATATAASAPASHLPPHWRSKQPPLFQEGAPYPPPLFIRDTYNQSLPQPPPRKIKRPKRRYRCEEPTSIMNSIRLRPRQVLCDKCKGVVPQGGAGHRESRRSATASHPASSSASDARSEDSRRRRQPADGTVASAAPVSAKRSRGDSQQRVDTQASSGKRSSSSALRVTPASLSSSSSSSSSRALRGVASSSSSSSPQQSSRVVRLKMNSKQKGLRGKRGANSGVDQRPKARRVLKPLGSRSQQTVQQQPQRPQRPPSDRTRQRRDTAPPSSSSSPAPAPSIGARTVTRSAALLQVSASSNHQKVHFTRRLQQRHPLSAPAAVSAGLSPNNHHHLHHHHNNHNNSNNNNSAATPLPPRTRLKPQRYRTVEDGAQSSPSPPSLPPSSSSSVHLPSSSKHPPIPPDRHPNSQSVATTFPASSSLPAPVPTASARHPASPPHPAPPVVLNVPACRPLSPTPSTSSSSSSAPLSSSTGVATDTQESPPPGAGGERRDEEKDGEEELEVEEEGKMGGEGCVAGREGSRDSPAVPSNQEVTVKSLEASPPPPPPPPPLQLLTVVAVDDGSPFPRTADPDHDSKPFALCSSAADTLDFPPPGNLLSSSSSSSCSYSDSSSSTPPPPPSPSSLLTPPGPSPSPSSSSFDGAAPLLSPPPLPDGCQEEHMDLREERDVTDGSSGGSVGDEGKQHAASSRPAKPATFSKSVSKCVAQDGRSVCVGDIVWAKIYGFPWWPARVVAITVSRRRDTGLTVRQEARVSWFGSPTTSFLPLAQLSPFLESFRVRFDKKRKRGPYRRAVAEAARAAKQLTPEVRALLTQFET